MANIKSLHKLQGADKQNHVSPVAVLIKGMARGPRWPGGHAPSGPRPCENSYYTTQSCIMSSEILAPPHKYRYGRPTGHCKLLQLETPLCEPMRDYAAELMVVQCV